MNKKITRIKGVEFVRDFGGITQNSEQTRYNVIYRTSKLSKINQKTKEKIAKILNINKIIDFRTTAEVEYKPDKKIDNIKYLNLPVLRVEDNPVVNKKNALKELKKTIEHEGGTIGYMKKVYRTLISSEQAISEYRNFLKELLDSEGSIIYHCTQGKDRTGIASAIILMALGYDEETIKKDYLNYNKLHKIKRALIFIGVTIIFLSIKKAQALRNLLIARIEYINSSFDEIKTKFGSIHNYIHQILGLNDQDIEVLKTKLIEK